MDPATILIIVNICVSTIAVPITLGIVNVMKRLKKSDCCCAHIELDRSSSSNNVKESK